MRRPIAAVLFANNTDHFTFRHNSVAGGPTGISIGPFAINGLIARNVVSGASAALSLAFNPNFMQTIRLNDFTDYSVAVRTTNNFTVPTDIAADTGNYWGLGCPGFGSGLGIPRLRFGDGCPARCGAALPSKSRDRKGDG